MRILTAQSINVWASVLLDGVYFPDPAKQRCLDDYKVDRDLLGGYQPIYGIELKEADYSNKRYNGQLIWHHLEVMRATSGIECTKYVFMELEVPDEECRYSEYHQGGGEWVFPCISQDYLLSAFLLTPYPRDLHSSAWFFRSVLVLGVYTDKPVLYRENLDTLQYYLEHEEELE